MYFIDIDERYYEDHLPSVAMNYNGKYIEDLVPGYKTLNVRGRETISHTINTSGDTSSIDGDHIGNKTLPARMITIQYRLTAPSNETFQRRFRDLMYALDTGQDDTTIYFDDDSTIKYKGQLSEMEEVPPDRNTVVGEYTIYCQDPHKYTRQTTESLSGSTTEITADGVLSNYEVTPEMIQLSATRSDILSGERIVITNERSKRKIIMNIPSVGMIELFSGQYIGVDIGSNSIRINDDKRRENMVKYLEYETTDFHQFKIRPGDTISVEPDWLNINVITRGVYK